MLIVKCVKSLSTAVIEEELYMGTKSKGISFWLSVLLTPLIWMIAVVVSLFCCVTSFFFILPFSLIFERQRLSWMHFVAVCWAKLIVAFTPLWKVSIEGTEYIRKDKTYFIVANHQSLLDILIVLSKLPLHFKFLAKDELFSIPFIGWNMRFAGYIPIVRSSKESGKRAFDRAKEWIQRGVSVLFFPEGTRSQDGEIKDFKVGAFKLARELGADILPVIIDGTGDVMPKKSWRLNLKSNFHLVVEKPISSKEVSEDTNSVKERIREKMIHRLEKIRSQT